MAKSGKASRIAVWTLMAFLVIGLGGFGAVNLSGNIRTVGDVGDMPITVNSYVRELQAELNALSAQTGRAVPFSEAQAMGITDSVVARLVTTRALDNEAASMGLSVGDERLSQQILDIDAFRGSDGSFNRDAYRFALERANLSEAEFETGLREETARTILQGAVVTGVEMPKTYTDTMLRYLAERRDFVWSELPMDGAEPLLPDDATLTAYYQAAIDRYTLPETKAITYAWLTPDMLIDSVEVEEEALRQAYAARAEEFSQPELRLTERLVFSDEASAQAAADSLASGSTDFEALVAARGLSLSDIDLGDVSQADLGAAGDAVFAAEIGAVVGPVPSSLGPALFRVNGVLPAEETPFEDAAPMLREELAIERARRVIDQSVGNIDDLLAGGASLEELAEETDMVLGQIDWAPGRGADIAAYPEFEAAAAEVTAEDFPEVANLDDGGIFALRLDAVRPPHPEPLDEIRDRVVADWQAEQEREALLAEAEGLAARLQEGAAFQSLELTPRRERGIERGSEVEGVPATVLARAFELEVGQAAAVATRDGRVILVRLEGVVPPSDSDADVAALREGIARQAAATLSQDLFEIFARDVQTRARPEINPQALNAVHANFR